MTITTTPDLATLLHPYKMTSADKHRLALLLAHAYLTAKYDAYQRAARTVAPHVRVRTPWKPSHHDAQQALQWATKQAEGIAATYETLLEHVVAEMLGQERALGDVIGKVKDVVSAIGDWFRRFLPWKSQQIANSTEGQGDYDGVMALIEELQNDGKQDLFEIEVYPEKSSSDLCSLYAGHRYPLSAAHTVPRFPAHPSCQHRVRIIAA
jgi:hypothetical protein